MELVNNRKPLPKRLERIVFNLTSSGGKIRHRKLNGRDHLVIPSVMMTEGVHNGSRGPGFYSEAALKKSDFQWDHMPIVVYHPKKKGKPISARTASVLNSSKIGLVLNTKTSGKKQRFEAWIDYKLAKRVDARIIKSIENGEKVEVSTGIGCKRNKKTGKWGSEEYKWEAADIQADHLAILPDQKGACSIEDGAGLGVFNAAFKKLTLGARKSLRNSVRNALKQVGGQLVKNEMSFSEQMTAVSEALAAAYGEKGKYWRGYVQEVFPTYVIFCDSYGGGKMWKVSYTVSKSGEVSLSGDKVEVERTTKYVAVSNALTNKGEGMKPEAKKKMVARIVANITGVKKATVEKMEDDEIRALYKSTKKPEPPEPVVVNKTKVKRVEVPSNLTTKELVKLLPKNYRAVINNGLKARERDRAEWIKAVEANPKNQFKKEFLTNEEKCPDSMLQGLAALAKTETDDDDLYDDGIIKANFAGKNGKAPDVSNEEDLPEPMDLDSRGASKTA